jgi:hypothetical protein
MWICLNNAFFSIVHKDCAPDELLVRARRKGDIERVFPDAKVERTVGNDYLFRARINRQAVAEIIGLEITGVNYSNFKNSVRNDKLHSAYGRIWHVMADLQEIPPYSAPTRGTRTGRAGQRKQGDLGL